MLLLAAFFREEAALNISEDFKASTESRTSTKIWLGAHFENSILVSNYLSAEVAFAFLT